ncbi:hypothetical protein, partial [Stenotrophomonas sp. GbtcB23]|uniref:hypothetical protein n=1 Tax=Stenotrophomonas sp. GbtcB23 TaxID=2824768 RepID=UPI001C3055C2
ANERQLGPFAPTKIFTSREQPDEAALETLKLSKTVILGGANQLGDDFSIWPGVSASEFRRSGLRAVPFGIGINGDPNSNRAFCVNTIATLEAIHEKVEFSSWRCPRTVAALETALPSLKGRFLMTGCP